MTYIKVTFPIIIFHFERNFFDLKTNDFLEYNSKTQYIFSILKFTPISDSRKFKIDTQYKNKII